MIHLPDLVLQRQRESWKLKAILLNETKKKLNGIQSNETLDPEARTFLINNLINTSSLQYDELSNQYKILSPKKSII